MCEALSTVASAEQPRAIMAAESHTPVEAVVNDSDNGGDGPVLTVDESTRFLQFVHGNVTDFTNYKRMDMYRLAWAHVRDFTGNMSLLDFIGAIVRHIDGALNPKWIEVVHEKVAQNKQLVDYLPTLESAEHFLKLRSRIMHSLLLEWASGSSKITSTDYEKTMQRIIPDAFEEIAAFDVQPRLSTATVRCNFWTDAIAALHPEVIALVQLHVFVLNSSIRRVRVSCHNVILFVFRLHL